MKRFLVPVIAVTATVLVFAVVKASGGGSRSEIVIYGVVEHADTDATTDTGKRGDSAGDVLTFANDVYDRTDSRKVGTDQGFCIRTVAGKAYECHWTTFLPRGQITVAGPFYDAGPSTLAITGGTGAYRNVRGLMQLKAHNPKATKFDFVFKLS
jgi:allene oxide cyclase-like protein